MERILELSGSQQDTAPFYLHFLMDVLSNLQQKHIDVVLLCSRCVRDYEFDEHLLLYYSFLT